MFGQHHGSQELQRGDVMGKEKIWGSETLLSIPLEKSGWSLDLLIWEDQHYQYNTGEPMHTKVELCWNIRGKVKPEDKESIAKYCDNDMAQNIIDYILGERKRANGPFR